MYDIKSIERLITRECKKHFLKHFYLSLNSFKDLQQYYEGESLTDLTMWYTAIDDIIELMIMA